MKKKTMTKKKLEEMDADEFMLHGMESDNSEEELEEDENENEHSKTLQASQQSDEGYVTVVGCKKFCIISVKRIYLQLNYFILCDS